jgi:phosphoserine phosphatase RsbU/P
VSDGEHYVTLLLAEIDTQKRTVRFVNCGHNPALLFRADRGRVIRMNSSCPPVGMFSEETCEVASSGLSPGDVLVLYTDGVTEAQNRAGEEFGSQRLSDFVRRGSSGSAEELMRGIVHSAADFSGDAGFSDDVTVVVVKCVF